MFHMLFLAPDVFLITLIRFGGTGSRRRVLAGGGHPLVREQGESREHQKRGLIFASGALVFLFMSILKLSRW